MAVLLEMILKEIATGKSLLPPCAKNVHAFFRFVQEFWLDIPSRLCRVKTSPLGHAVLPIKNENVLAPSENMGGNCPAPLALDILPIGRWGYHPHCNQFEGASTWTIMTHLASSGIFDLCATRPLRHTPAIHINHHQSTPCGNALLGCTSE